jgi:hypothetical protein
MLARLLPSLLLGDEGLRGGIATRFAGLVLTGRLLSGRTGSGVKLVRHSLAKPAWLSFRQLTATKRIVRINLRYCS